MLEQLPFKGRHAFKTGRMSSELRRLHGVRRCSDAGESPQCDLRAETPKMGVETPEDGVRSSAVPSEPRRMNHGGIMST